MSVHDSIDKCGARVRKSHKASTYTSAWFFFDCTGLYQPLRQCTVVSDPHMHCRRASPLPWKNRNERKKSAIKIKTREITTALVVDSPTPLAPPVVVKPQEQLTQLISVPKTTALMHDVMISNDVNAFATESNMMFADTSYTTSASRTEAPMPIAKHRTLRTGPAIIQASTRGVTK